MAVAFVQPHERPVTTRTEVAASSSPDIAPVQLNHKRPVDHTAEFWRRVQIARQRLVCLWVVALVLLLASTLLVLVYGIIALTVRVPTRSVHHFLGFNVIYAAQPPGWLFESPQAIAAATPLLGGLLVSAANLWWRRQKIDWRDRDVGLFTWRSIVTAVLRLARAGIVAAAAVVYWQRLLPYTNDPIRNDVFFSACELTPIQDSGVLPDPKAIRGNMPIDCAARLSYNTLGGKGPFRGSFPNNGEPGNLGFNGSMLAWMRPVGTQMFCDDNLLPTQDQLSLAAKPLRRCRDPRGLYAFSNWATLQADRSDEVGGADRDCDPLVHAAFYEGLGLDYRFAEQWFCNLSVIDDGVQVTVRYSTVSFRRFLPDASSCTLGAQDAPQLSSLQPTAARDVGNRTRESRIRVQTRAMTPSQLQTLMGEAGMDEAARCHVLEVGCVPHTSAIGATVMSRSTALHECSIRMSRPPTVAVDEANWAGDVSRLQSVYLTSVIAQAAEVALDLAETLAKPWL